MVKRWLLDDLIEKDKLFTERKSLKDLILEMEDEVLANAGVDVFEEVFKLIFTKLYDEMESGRNKDRYLEFRNYGDTDVELKEKIQRLFDKARGRWEGVFTEDAKLTLTPSHLSVCVSSLQDVKLFNSNLDVVDDAFEYLMNKSSKGEKGQYFTPRYIIDMCVKMLNPKPDETMIEMAITVNLRYTGTSGKARAFAEEMMSSSGTVEKIRAEQGNLRYEYYVSLEDSETVLLIDSWANQAAIDAHHASPMMATIATLREKYDLHMTMERFVSTETPETENQYIRK